MSSSMRNYGNWAVVTGASSGIGMAMAERVCRDGVNCILVSNERKPLEETARSLADTYHVETIACCCDLSLPGSIEVIRRAVNGRAIDILVSCASFGILGPFYDTEIETYLANVNISVVSYLTLTYEYLRDMLDRDRGAVILIASVNAFAPVGYSAVYTAAKAFELYFGEALWKELHDRKSKVDILTVCASATRTNFQARAGTRIAPWAWEPNDVVDAALKKLGKRPSVTISWRGKLFQLISRFLPRRLSLSFSTWAILSTLKNGQSRS
jgi:short-subunit dehydrogenase